MKTWRDAHARADDAGRAVRVALEALGLPDGSLLSIRAQVTADGRAFVHVGTLRADHAELVAEALRSYVPSELDDAGRAAGRE
jgi:hypothetical protein